MTESLRPLRAAAAWVIVAYVGLSEMVGLFSWAVAVPRLGPREAFALTFFPSETKALLVAAAVAIAAVAGPAAMGARAIAVIAFLEAGLMLLWSFANISLLLVKWAETVFSGNPLPVQALQHTVDAAGVVVLSGLAAFFAWLVQAASDPLAREIRDLAEQIADLDEEARQA